MGGATKSNIFEAVRGRKTTHIFSWANSKFVVQGNFQSTFIYRKSPKCAPEDKGLKITKVDLCSYTVVCIRLRLKSARKNRQVENILRIFRTNEWTYHKDAFLLQNTSPLPSLGYFGHGWDWSRRERNWSHRHDWREAIRRGLDFSIVKRCRLDQRGIDKGNIWSEYIFLPVDIFSKLIFSPKLKFPTTIDIQSLSKGCFPFRN